MFFNVDGIAPTHTNDVVEDIFQLSITNDDWLTIISIIIRSCYLHAWHIT